MPWNIEFNAGETYEIDHKPTPEDIKNFIDCFVSDLQDGYIEITHEYYELEED